MSVVDMLSRISQIESSINQMSAQKASSATLGGVSATEKTTEATATNAAKFAEVLSTAETGSTKQAAAATGTATGADVVEAAKKYIGVPYVWGGTDPTKGLDCSGLVQRVYKDLGIDVPRVTYDQIKTGTTVPNLAAAKPGDLLFMHNVSHVGIYVGDNKYIHAPVPGQNVRIDSIPAGASFDKITRIIPEAAATTAVPAAGSTANIVAAAQAALLKGSAA